MPYRKNQTNAQIVPLALAGGEGETKTGAMSVDRYREGFSRPLPYSGSLGRQWRAIIGERFHLGKVTAAIYSYSTIIAWQDADYGWIIPLESYSTTTSSRHQSQLYRIGGRRIAAPWDATDDDMRRVLSGELVFTHKGYGSSRVFTGTRPGPNHPDADKPAPGQDVSGAEAWAGGW